MPGDQDSDSEGSSVENLGDVTQFGLTGALAQMANLTFMAGAPGINLSDMSLEVDLLIVVCFINRLTVLRGKSN